MSQSHTTYVFALPNEEAARSFHAAIYGSYPFGENVEGPAITGMSSHDVMSSSDAARLALESPALDEAEKIELALELFDCRSWDECTATFDKWDLRQNEYGELVDAAQVQA